MEKKTNLEPRFYVGIGASAGGLEAIENFFSQLPPDTGMSFIIVQHLSPDYKSLMVELLSKKTSMRVLRAEDQVLVERNTVYLIPPKKNMTIFHGRLMLTDQKPGHGLNLPIDIFLNSLAQDQGMKAVAVILSGTGSDGMRGVKSIKEAGGLIMVQDQETAKFDGMPRSAISTGLADFVLPPDEMPSMLIKCMQNSGKIPRALVEPQKLDHENIARIFSMLRGRVGVDFTFYKPSTILRRLERRMSLNQITELGDYVRFLENVPHEVSQLYKELLIGVTSFFRDPEFYDYLYQSVIPRFFEEGEGVRFWVSGCSTGEEAYSYAMLIADYLEKASINADVKIFATDIDKDAIQFAGNGIYPESSAAEIGQARVLKYFQHVGDKLQVCRRLREMVVFAQHNLVKDPPFTNIDLVSCRNLLIYLQPVLQKKAISMFQFALKPEGKGVLVLGSSETPGDVSDCFQPLDRKLKIYKTIGRRKVSLESEFLNNFVRKSDGFAKTPTVLNHCNCQDEKVLDRLLQVVSGENLPLIILVNENSEIIYLAGDATGILKFPSGRMNNEITKLLGREVSIPVTSGIQKVIKTGREVVYSNVKVGKKNDLRHFDLHIRPLPSRKGQEPLIAIMFHCAGNDSGTLNARKGQNFDLNHETEQRIADIEQELQFTRENLQATIEELETSNEELQATNEELLSSNEELQSTNEELQSVNEELFTVNSEYQNKIIELTELNNDIDNLLMAADIGTIFLDENLEIRKFTPYVNRVIKVLDHDIGRPFAHLSHHIGSINLIEMVNRVVNTLSGETTEYFAPDGRWYMIKVLPYKISPKSISGVVISFIDINQVKSMQNSLHRETELLALAGEITGIGGWEIDLKSGQIYWSKHVYSIYGISPDIRPDDVPGQMEFYDESVRPQLNEALQKAKEDGSNFDLTLPFCNAHNNRLWVRILGRGLSLNGKVVKIQGTIQDVTENYRESLARHRVCDILQTMIDYSGKHLPETIDRICQKFLHILIDHGKYESAWVALKNGGASDKIKITAAHGIGDESFESKEVLNLKHSLDDAFSNVETFLTVEDLLKSGRKKNSKCFREYCFFPVGIHRKIYGILAVKIPVEGFGSKMEIQVLRKLAANIAAGLETFENEVEK